jgi:hypothetical protein
MSRIRTVKPDTFRSETLAEVPLSTERTFIGLWCEVDDEGRFRERAAVLHGALWPLRTDHSVRDVEDDLNILADKKLTCRYEIGGVKYLHLPSWKEHQRINRPTPSRLPACPTCAPEQGGCGTPAPSTDHTLFSDATGTTGN